MMARMDVVGRYRVERRIGSGSFSTVWLARDEALDVPVAIKVLSDNWIGNEDVRSRFIDEARLLRRIEDRRIIAVHDIGQLPDGRDYFVMDYAPVGTVADLCRAPLPPRTALHLGAELARAVQALHDNGVLHRDLKPANLLLAGSHDQPHVVLADLGTSKRLAESSGLTMTAGTPAYMAPEQARGDALDVRCDVYGIGAVCYRMLAGEVPFPDEDLAAVALRSPDRRPPPLPERVGTESEISEIDRLLQQALSTEPDDRPPTAAAIAESLQHLAGAAPLPTDSGQPSSPADATEVVDHSDETTAQLGDLLAATRAEPPEPGSSPDVARATRPDRSQLAGAILLAVLVAVVVWAGLSLLTG